MNTQAIRAYTTAVLISRDAYHRDRLVIDGLCENDCGRKRDHVWRKCWACRRTNRKGAAA